MYEKPSNPEDEGAGYGFKNAGIKEMNVYFYHSDHLGSTTYITDRDGNATQFVSYKPYGEALVDEHATSFEMPWKFNGKEFDSETGLYYYGARYYEPALALWYGVDALAEKYPSVGGYVYCVGNPVRLVDVDGKWPGVTFLFQQAKLSLGIGYGLYVGCQNGVAWDDNGKTHYNMYAIYHFNNQKLYDGSREPTFLIEGSVDFLSGNVKHDWEHNTFIEAISDNAKCSLNIKLGANWGIAEDGVTLGIGCSIGADFFEMVNMKIAESISLSDKESDKLDELSGRVVYAPWSVKNVDKQCDKNGKITGYSGVVYTEDCNCNNINTGIVVNCNVTQEGKPTKIWTSSEYNKGSIH